jgi:hypothetical protein
MDRISLIAVAGLENLVGVSALPTKKFFFFLRVWKVFFRVYTKLAINEAG